MIDYKNTRLYMGIKNGEDLEKILRVKVVGKGHELDLRDLFNGVYGGTISLLGDRVEDTNSINVNCSDAKAMIGTINLAY